jgi:hypothetical protein
MSELEYTESNHPVLQGYRDRVGELEAQVADLQTKIYEAEQRTREVRQQKWQYEERVKNVLVEAYEDHDQDTIEHIASNLDIDLTISKRYEVNVTFTIDVETKIGEEIDADWDFQFEVTHDDIIDQSADVIWSKEIS